MEVVFGNAVFVGLAAVAVGARIWFETTMQSNLLLAAWTVVALLLKYALIVGLGVFVVRLVALFLRNDAVGRRGLNDLDNPELDLLYNDQDQGERDAATQAERFRAVRGGGRWVAKVAWETKARLGGTPADTPLNREQAWKVARAVMREWTDNSHRTNHYMRDLPLAVEMVFTPTNEELAALQYRYSFPVFFRKWGFRHPFL